LIHWDERIFQQGKAMQVDFFAFFLRETKIPKHKKMSVLKSDRIV
jgi:hypothetical protein